VALRRLRGRRPTAASAVSSPTSLTEHAEADVEMAVVKSPIVGTFYRSPNRVPSFVEIGTSVKKGQVLCIIEAMN
jgi:biotin carboxyl carrier protein